MFEKYLQWAKYKSKCPSNTQKMAQTGGIKRNMK